MAVLRKNLSLENSALLNNKLKDLPFFKSSRIGDNKASDKPNDSNNRKKRRTRRGTAKNKKKDILIPQILYPNTPKNDQTNEPSTPTTSNSDPLSHLSHLKFFSPRSQHKDNVTHRHRLRSQSIQDESTPSERTVSLPLLTNTGLNKSQTSPGVPVSTQTDNFDKTPGSGKQRKRKRADGNSNVHSNTSIGDNTTNNYSFYSFQDNDGNEAAANNNDNDDDDDDVIILDHDPTIETQKNKLRRSRRQKRRKRRQDRMLKEKLESWRKNVVRDGHKIRSLRILPSDSEDDLLEGIQESNAQESDSEDNIPTHRRRRHTKMIIGDSQATGDSQANDFQIYDFQANGNDPTVLVGSNEAGTKHEPVASTHHADAAKDNEASLDVDKESEISDVDKESDVPEDRKNVSESDDDIVLFIPEEPDEILDSTRSSQVQENKKGNTKQAKDSSSPSRKGRPKINRKPNENKSIEVGPSENVPNEAGPSENVPSENLPIENVPGENRPSENRPSENRPSENRRSENRPSENGPKKSAQQEQTEENIPHVDTSNKSLLESSIRNLFLRMTRYVAHSAGSITGLENAHENDSNKNIDKDITSNDNITKNNVNKYTTDKDNISKEINNTQSHDNTSNKKDNDEIESLSDNDISHVINSTNKNNTDDNNGHNNTDNDINDNNSDDIEILSDENESDNLFVGSDDDETGNMHIQDLIGSLNNPKNGKDKSDVDITESNSPDKNIVTTNRLSSQVDEVNNVPVILLSDDSHETIEHRNTTNFDSLENTDDTAYDSLGSTESEAEHMTQGSDNDESPSKPFYQLRTQSRSKSQNRVPQLVLVSSDEEIEVPSTPRRSQRHSGKLSESSNGKPETPKRKATIPKPRNSNVILNESPVASASGLSR